MEEKQELTPTWHPLLDGYEGSTVVLAGEQTCLLISYESLEQAIAAKQWLAGDLQ